MNIPFDHPSIEIEKPADGHYIITGQPGGSAFIEGQGHLAIEPSCHIHPGIPSDALLAILADRGDISAEPPAVDIETLAGDLYERYCEAVGGKAFNGDPLPSWAEFRADEKKQKQSDAWVAVAMVALGVEEVQVEPEAEERPKRSKRSAKNEEGAE